MEKNTCVYSDTDAFLQCYWKQYFAKLQHGLHLWNWRKLRFFFNWQIRLGSRRDLRVGWRSLRLCLGSVRKGYAMDLQCCHGTPWRGVRARACFHMHMHVYVHMCVYACTCAFTCECMCMCAHICTCACMCTCTCACMCARTCLLICMHVCVHACMRRELSLCRPYMCCPYIDTISTYFLTLLWTTAEAYWWKEKVTCSGSHW